MASQQIPVQSQLPSTEQHFNQGISPIVSYIVNLLCDYVRKRHNVEVSSNDFVQNVLMLPAGTPSTPVAANLPPFMSGVVTSAAPATTTRRRKVSSKEPLADNLRCVYEMTRGAHVGQRCTNHVVPDTNLCRSCAKKKGSDKYKNKNADGNTPTAVVGGMVAPPQQPSRQMKVEPTSETGVFRECTRGFIVKQLPKGGALAYEIQPTPTEARRPMTEEEKRYAMTLGFAVPDSDKETQTIAAPLFPGAAPPVSTTQVPTIPMAGQAPQIPLPTAAIPAVSNVVPPIPASIPAPAIPQIPTAAPGVPQMTAQAAPAVPGLPQMGVQPVAPPVVPSPVQAAPAIPGVPQMVAQPMAASAIPQLPTAIAAPQVPQVPAVGIPQMPTNNEAQQ